MIKHMYKYMTVYICGLLTLVIILLLIFWNDTEYKANLITELTSVVLTIGLINVIFNKKDAIEKEKRNCVEILRLNNLFYIYVNQYHICVKRIFGEELKEIKYSDMSKLLKISPTRINFSYEKAFNDYFRRLLDLKEQAQSFIEKLDLGKNDPLIEELEKFIIQNRFLSELYIGFKNRENMVQGRERKPCLDYDIEMLEKTTIPPEINVKTASLHDPYVFIFEDLQKNINFINNYINILEKTKEKLKEL